ncbi:MAG: hypothetical protein ACNA8P_09535 [Phycisphaerales bacterium]
MKTVISVSAVLALSGAAMADVLLIVDLTVPNQITINSTTGLSAIDATASNFNGVYLENAFGLSGALGAVLVSGNLTSFNNPSDNSPSLFRGGAGADPGLNIWSYSTDATTSFTAGVQAFAGSGTWNLSTAGYEALLAGASSGNIYANIDNIGGVPGNGILGTWALIPTPGAAGLLGLAGLAAVRRRR